MNERTRELAKQAGIDDVLVPSEAIEKFAELIIKDVTNMLPDDSIRDKDGTHMYYVIRDRYGVDPWNRKD
jgi:hypothetical protein